MWGRRLLMCRPEHFTVLYEINPWMHADVRPDPDQAMAQFEGLVAQLRAAGAEIDLMEPVEELPDLVFTGNAGVVNGGQFVPARFRHPERRGEVACNTAWFAAHGFTVDWLPEHLVHEGAGDALPFGTPGEPLVLVTAFGSRSDAASHVALSKLTGAPVRSVELTDERLFHLDLTFCPLDDRRAMVAPLGLDPYGRKVIDALVPELLVLEDDEALAFCTNSVVVGDNIVMPCCPPRLGRTLEAWGFSVGVAPVDEFRLAGGACRCLTLALDVELRQPPTGSTSNAAHVPA
jgi:N-dimethylarginine dimethylaminohydrolase